MARQTYEAWLPEDPDSTVWHSIRRTSVIESVAKRIPMNSDTKTFPRSGDMTVDVVPKGTAYGEDVSPNDEVVMASKKFGRVVRIAEEDIDDTVIDLLTGKKLDWASAYAKHIDNACLGTSAAIGVGVPFTSVYRAVTTAEAFTGYQANANHQVITQAQLAGATSATYDALSRTLETAESSDFFDEGNALVLAHTSFKAVFRGVKDSQGNPIFLQGLAGTPDTLFGYPVRWARGAKVTATATSNPPVQNTGGAAGSAAKGTAGNPLLIIADPSYLMLGVRSGPESVVIPGRDGVSSLTDETILKMRARRAFVPAYPQAFSVLERTV